MKSITITVGLAATILASSTVAESVARDQQPESQPTWEELGFNGLPDGLSTDGIALIESLNRGRGSWSFEGRASQGDVATPIHGKLDIAGSSKNGMIPMWNMALGWPLEDPRNTLNYILMIGPKKDGVDMMLIRMGPMEIGPNGEPLKERPMKVRRTPFKGTWDLERRTVLWTERDLPVKAGPREQEAGTRKKETFEMMFAATGEITIRPPGDTADRPDITGKVTARIGQPLPEEKPAFNKDIGYDTFADISEPRVKPYLPPQAVEITLHLERGGHFARYKVSGKDFHNHLDDLWATHKNTSAHQRDEMGGEGEAVDPQDMERRCERRGWKPPRKAIRYYSPSKRSGAIT
ncbi:MAG: hypothetical protein AAF492_02850, partial [Verrucomicrobiota bacterium]